MNNKLFWLIFSILGVAYLLIALFSSKNIKNKNDYFLAGQNYGFITLTFTLVATQVGAGMLLGTAQEVYNIGLYGLLYNSGTCLGFLLLGSGIAAKFHKFKITTIAEIFEKKYKSKKLRKIASILSIITLSGILSAQILASRKIMAIFNLDADFIIIIFWLIVISYTMFGGLKAVIATDIFQIILLISIFLGIFIYSMYNDKLIFIKNYTLNKSIYTSNIDRPSFSNLLPFLLMPICFSLIEQDLAQRFFAAKNQKTTILASLFSALFIMIFSLIPTYFGVKARILKISILNNSNPLIEIIKNINMEFILILTICALIAAITSTADSLLCAISSNIVNDFQVKKISNNKKLIKNNLLFSRIVTLIIGLISIFLAYNLNNIISIMTQSYELSVSCLFIPVVLCFFKEKLEKKAAFFSILFGLSGFIVFRIFEVNFPKEILSLLMSLIGYIFGMLISNKKKNIFFM